MQGKMREMLKVSFDSYKLSLVMLVGRQNMPKTASKFFSIRIQNHLALKKVRWRIEIIFQNTMLSRQINLLATSTVLFFIKGSRLCQRSGRILQRESEWKQCWNNHIQHRG